MERHYDIFELLPDDSLLWREVAIGLDNAILRLKEIAAKTKNEVRVIHLPTKALIAAMNVRPTEPQAKIVGFDQAAWAAAGQSWSWYSRRLLTRSNLSYEIDS